MLPVWAGLPLGLFDDLYSGQPLGSGVLLWSIAVIVLDVVETRFPWRGFALELAGRGGNDHGLSYLAQALRLPIGGGRRAAGDPAPDTCHFATVYPLICRLVALLDRFRLMPVREA
jgi:rod shape-determining protein MreD